MTPLRGYNLTILAWHLQLFPETVEGTPVDGFRVTHPLTGVSVEWCPHLEVQQARILFWDVLPLHGVDVRGDTYLIHDSDRRIGYYQTYDLRLREMLCGVAWSETYYGPLTFTEAEALLWVACQAMIHIQR